MDRNINLYRFIRGVVAALAVMLATTIPLRKSRGAPDDMTSPLHRLEHALSPWVGFLIVPIFGWGLHTCVTQ